MMHAEAGMPRWIKIHVGLVIFLSLLPIIVVLPVSFNATTSMSLPTEGVSLRWYQSLVHDGPLLRSLWLSVLVATASSLIAMIVGIPCAYVIARRNLRMLDAILLSPITFPAVVFGAALLMVLSPLGLVRTVFGLIGAHTAVVLPFVIRTMVSTFHGIDHGLEEAATMLGADRSRICRHILLPLAGSGIISSVCFAFIISFDEFSVSLFLVGTQVMTLPLEMYQRMQFIIDPTIAAVSVMLILVTVALVVGLDRLVNFERLFQAR
jgi:putative spermidine/putrescine transport system permease protein